MTRLFHVSDIHFGAEDPVAIDWFADLVRDEQPDAVICSGDLTMRARHREFDQAERWLAALGRPVTVEVGNHDLPYFNLWARFVTPYKRYEAVEHLVEKPLDIAGLSVVPLKTTARFQPRLDWSKGHVSHGALRKALEGVAQAPKGNLIFCVCHHPLVDEGTRIGGRTTGGRHALEALAKAGVAAVLTGHTHDPFDAEYQVAGRQVRLIGAGTLSTRTRTSPPEFNEIRIEGGTFHVVARTMTPAPDQVVPKETKPIPAG
jgi:3',5'-cyclic AMP phosphodiesterase CpdA